MTTIATAPQGDAAPAPPTRPYGFVGLPISIVLIFGLALLICVFVGIAALAIATLAIGLHPALDALGALRHAIVADKTQLVRAGVVVSIVVYAAISVAVLAAARLRGGRRWRDLIAWRPWQPFRAAGPFWLLVVLTIAYDAVAGVLIEHYYPAAQDWVTLPEGPGWVALFVLLAVVMAPLTEELLFRGWLYTALRASLAPQAGAPDLMERAAAVFDQHADHVGQDTGGRRGSLGSVGVWVSLVATAAVFALAHWEKSHLYAAAVFPVGLALGLVRERTGSIVASMTFHAVYNAAALATTALGF